VGRAAAALAGSPRSSLERAGEAILAAVEVVSGVEHVAVDQLHSDTSVFMVVVRGGDDQDVARAIIRAFPQGTVTTAGNTKVEVGDQAVWLCRPRPSE